MARLLTIIFALMYSVSLMAAPAVVQNASGDVKAVMGNASPFVIAKDSVLENGVMVTTGENSQVAIKFEDGQIVALNSNASFKIDQYNFNRSKPEKSSIIFSLIKGGMRAITGLIARSNADAFKLNTGVATIGIRGTDFMVATGSLYLQVVQGMVSATNVAGTTEFAAGQFGFISSASVLPATIAAAQLPAGVAASFSQLGAMPLAGAGAGGVSSGAGASPGAAGVGAAAGGLGAGTVVVIGAAVAGVAAAVSGGGSSTTTHH